MADVESTQYQEFANPIRGKVDAASLGGRIRSALATFSASSGNPGNGEVVRLTWLPRNARIVEVKVATDGVGGMTDEDIGDANDADGLVDGMDLSSGAQNEVVADGIAAGFTYATDAPKALWELLGYSKAGDAPAQIEVILTSSGATGSGNVNVQFQYVVD
jgi:hypothetical protein